MKVTHVPIRVVKENRGENIVALVAVFLLGATLGSGLILLENNKLRLPASNPNEQLGAVALTDITTGNSASLAPINTIPTPVASTEEVAQVAQEIVQNSATLRAAKQTRSELQLEINDRTIAIDRLNQEIERVKNASVALVTAFDQNCGNWTDVCAKPYTDKLDESNSSYNELVEKLAAMNLILASLKQELSSLEN